MEYHILVAISRVAEPMANYSLSISVKFYLPGEGNLLTDSPCICFSFHRAPVRFQSQKLPRDRKPNGNARTLGTKFRRAFGTCTPHRSGLQVGRCSHERLPK